MPDNPKRAALYVRVSTDEQAAEGYSLDAQKNILEDHCLAEGLDVASIYEDDGYSGRNVNRPAYRRLMSEMDDWDDLLMLSNRVNYDHLFVAVSARRGFISYNNSFDKLPTQISKYFSNCSVMVLYPEQKGDPIENLSFSNPHGIAESKFLDRVGKGVKEIRARLKAKGEV